MMSKRTLDSRGDAMAESTRVVFTFDDNSLDVLKESTERGNFTSMAETVRQSIRLLYTLLNEAEDGFDEVVVRNRAGARERILVVPFLKKVARTAAARR
jgi:hypothetical protein